RGDLRRCGSGLCRSLWVCGLRLRFDPVFHPAASLGPAWRGGDHTRAHDRHALHVLRGRYDVEPYQRIYAGRRRSSHSSRPVLPQRDCWDLAREMAAVAAMTPLLMTKGLSRTFGGLKAVDSVDFSLAEGEIRAVIGPNGAGKTTLVSL